MRAALTLLLAAQMLGACSEREPANSELRDQVREQIETNLAERKDVPAADKAAVAEAVADDLVSTAEQGAELQPQIDASNAQLERQLGSVDDAKARDCAQQRLELEGLRRMQANADVENLDAASRAELPSAIAAAESRIAAACN